MQTNLFLPLSEQYFLLSVLNAAFKLPQPRASRRRLWAAFISTLARCLFFGLKIAVRASPNRVYYNNITCTSIYDLCMYIYMCVYNVVFELKNRDSPCKRPLTAVGYNNNAHKGRPNPIRTRA